MMATFACNCGATKWRVTDVDRFPCAICYCADCQTFARHLNADILDDAGGTELMPVAPDKIAFDCGAENLAVLKLSPNGLMRWHTSCCNTPVANTLSKSKWPFASLMTASLQGARGNLRPVHARLNTVYAHGPNKPGRDHGLFRFLGAFMIRAIGARLTGRWKQTPFFTPPDWRPVASPRILSREERNRARP